MIHLPRPCAWQTYGSFPSPPTMGSMNKEYNRTNRREPSESGVAQAGDSNFARKGSFFLMLRRAFLPTFFDLYQLFLAVIGMVGVNRILFEYRWVLSVKYALVLVAAFWIGQGLLSLFQSRNPSLD